MSDYEPPNGKRVAFWQENISVEGTARIGSSTQWALST
jgi:hypothetical protein